MSDEEFSARVKLFIAHSTLYDEATRAQEYWQQIQRGIPPVARSKLIRYTLTRRICHETELPADPA
ncbi:hypothetical protein DSO57_1031939 [Entomophthora muscae]|uniref:Uncharacterized protein n=1 Tax=Entomophthora muscae TaxID=34485 RepID=A0ACC2T0H1_9FUNG|nr:hypothetical protein DSO57_1031939 [Entomophthora muscae]